MIWVAFSCDEFCEEMNHTAVVVNFYSSEANATVPLTVEIKGIENDSTLYNKTNHTQILLPVNPAADVMSFSIQAGDLPADTIIIRYIRHNGFISSECGCVTYAEILEESEIKGDSLTRLVITNPNVHTVSYRQGVENEENIGIYY